ncbi:hypothetical protein N7509_012677 [Penicillium cosmopolitanum]|uniref:Uncharacterized protein n=1 Tax=Penicillium cosmopolitanum TaxID=1131564 RepID=A0A9W9SNE2_9EURO|nr:uncharacterized protein N7509_012677 [Penicillium cosmopolitanum]KAJ5379558.1 hypothetical protein N7509_012677 [Penicillium cosmopolitanum]
MESLRPGYKPSLMMIFACLGDIHAERHQKTKRKADLDEAVWATRLALRISSADHPITTTLLNNLANGLWRRYRSTGHEDDLHQALFYGLQASETLFRVEDSDRAAVSGALGAIRGSLYDCRGDFQDLQEAISITRRSIDTATRWADTASVILFNNLGAYLWTQYCLTGRREDLDESVVTFVKALECLTDNTVDRVTCLINSGHVLAQRYHHTRQLEDLSCALQTAQEAMHLDPQNGDLTTLLKRLDRFLDRRHEPKSPVHWPKTHWNANIESGNPLILLAVFIFIVAMYAYQLRTEILFSMVAFPCGIICHWMISRRPTAKQRISLKDNFASISSMREHLASLGKSNEYNPKLLAVPLIKVPFASSLRGIQTSDFSTYSSLSYNGRRQSIHSVKSEHLVENRPSTGHRRDGDVKVHKGRYRGHRLMSPPRAGHGIPTIAATTPYVCVKSDYPKCFHPVMQNAIPQVEEDLSRNEMGSSRRQRETHVVGSYP